MSAARGHWSIPFGVAAALAALLAALGCFSLGGISLWGALAADRQTFLPLWAGVGLLVAGAILLGFASRPAWSVTAGRRGVGIRRLAGRQFIEQSQLREIRITGDGIRRRLEIVTHKGRIGVYPLPADAEGLCGHLKKLVEV